MGRNFAALALESLRLRLKLPREFLMRRLALAAVLAFLPLVAAAQDAPPAPPVPPAPGSPPDPSTGGPAGRPAMTPEMRSAFQAMRTACAADVARLCGDVQAGAQAGGGRGRGGAMRCMMQHAADVSPACSQAIGAVRALRHDDHG
jgi:hypothetical protein